MKQNEKLMQYITERKEYYEKNGLCQSFSSRRGDGADYNSLSPKMKSYFNFQSNNQIQFDEEPIQPYFSKRLDEQKSGDVKSVISNDSKGGSQAGVNGNSPTSGYPTLKCAKISEMGDSKEHTERDAQGEVVQGGNDPKNGINGCLQQTKNGESITSRTALFAHQKRTTFSKYDEKSLRSNGVLELNKRNLVHSKGLDGSATPRRTSLQMMKKRKASQSATNLLARRRSRGSRRLMNEVLKADDYHNPYNSYFHLKTLNKKFGVDFQFIDKRELTGQMGKTLEFYEKQGEHGFTLDKFRENKNDESTSSDHLFKQHTKAFYTPYQYIQEGNSQ